MLSDTKRAISLAEVKFGTEGGFVRDKLPMAVNFASIFDTELERLLVGHKNVANVHFGDGKLGLWAFALTGEIECEAFLVARDISEGCARVVIGTLWAEGHAAGHLCVWPYFAL